MISQNISTQPLFIGKSCMSTTNLFLRDLSIILRNIVITGLNLLSIQILANSISMSLLRTSSIDYPGQSDMALASPYSFISSLTSGSTVKASSWIYNYEFLVKKALNFSTNSASFLASFIIIIGSGSLPYTFELISRVLASSSSYSFLMPGDEGISNFFATCIISQ